LCKSKYLFFRKTNISTYFSQIKPIFRQNKGVLSKRARENEFGGLSEDEIRQNEINYKLGFEL